MLPSLNGEESNSASLPLGFAAKPLATSTAIWYPRARVNPEGGATTKRYSPNPHFETLQVVKCASYRPTAQPRRRDLLGGLIHEYDVA
jgi:hypothetical protein